MSENYKLDELLPLLQSDNVSTRAITVFGLGQLRDERAILPLVWLMVDESMWVRCSAAEALGEFRSPLVIEPLIEFLKLGAQLELETLGFPPEIPIRYHAFTRSPDKDYSAWIHTQGVNLGKPGFSLAVSARLGIQGIGVDATDALIDLLYHDNPYLVYLAVSLLQSMSMQKKPLDALLLALTVDEPNVRLNATRALARLGNLRAVRALQGLLNDEEQAIRSAVVESLGEIADPRAIPAIKAMLWDDAVHHVALTVLHQLDPTFKI